jgi:hemin uptake protein HemP
MANINRTITFYAQRNDGLGARLIPLFIAAALTKRYGGKLEFGWQEIPIMRLPSNAIETAEKTFTEAYRAKHMTCSPGPRKVLSVQQLIKPDQNYIGSHEINIYPETLYIEALIKSVFKDLDTDLLFREIGFLPRILSAYSRGRAAAEGKNFRALHLRSGDIVYGPQRFTGMHSSKAVPFPLIDHITKQLTDKGIMPIIFAEEAALPKHLKYAYNATLALENKHRTGDTVERAYFDIGLMSQAETIYSAESSFASIAALIGKSPIINPYNIFSAQEASEECEKYFEISRIEDACQKAFWMYATYTNYKSQHSLTTKLRLLEMANLADPSNKLYQLSRISETLAAGLGPLNMADLLSNSQNFQERGAIWEILKHRAAKSIVAIFQMACDATQDCTLAICVAYHFYCMNDVSNASSYAKIFLDKRPHELSWLDCCAWECIDDA